MTTVTFKPAGALRGSTAVPGDKSITHRALMIAAVSEDDTLIRQPLWAGDTRSTAACLQAMGVPMGSVPDDGAGGDRRPGEVAPLAGDVLVRGRGLSGLRAPDRPLDAGNSGTTLRLLAGLVAGGSGIFRFDGDDSLRRRPMDRIVAPLRAMGVAVEARDGRLLPLSVRGGEVVPLDYSLPVASAQVKSCVLLAGLHAPGLTYVREPAPARDHTERMLAAAGASIRRDGRVVTLRGRPRLRLGEVRVPGDASSAAFLVAAAALIPGSDLTVTGVGLNPTRTGFFETLRDMGADIEWTVDDPPHGDPPVAAGGAGPPGVEPVGGVRIRYAPLRGSHVPAERVPLLIDELPLLALVATSGDDETVVEGATELRHKESDRLEAIRRLLTAVGGRVETAPDSFRVRPAPLVGGAVDSGGDHRLAMLGAVAGLASRDGVTVRGFEASAVSFPGFADTLQEVLRP